MTEKEIQATIIGNSWIKPENGYPFSEEIHTLLTPESDVQAGEHCLSLTCSDVYCVKFSRASDIINYSVGTLVVVEREITPSEFEELGQNGSIPPDRTVNFEGQDAKLTIHTSIFLPEYE